MPPPRSVEASLADSAEEYSSGGDEDGGDEGLEEPGTKRNRGSNIHPDEDVVIAKGYVSATSHGGHGANYRGRLFWDDVYKRYLGFRSKSPSPVLQGSAPRPIGPLKERYRKFSKAVAEFNRHYKRVIDRPQSGVATTPDMNLQRAQDLWQEEKGYAFMFPYVVHILQKMPKFDPCPPRPNQAADDPNRVQVQGSTLQRPLGSKATKRLEKANKSETVGLKGQLDSLIAKFDERAIQAQRRADIKQREKGIKLQMEKAQFYYRMGDHLGSQEAIAKMKELESLHELALAAETTVTECEDKVEVLHVAPAAAAASASASASAPASFVTPQMAPASFVDHDDQRKQAALPTLLPDEELDETGEQFLETPHYNFEYDVNAPTEDV
jgi:hypothetical protein